MKLGVTLTAVIALGCRAPSEPRPAEPPAQPKSAPTTQLHFRNTGSLSDAQMLPYRRCSADNECVLVDNGCCTCMSSGIAASVRADAREAFAQNFACEDAMCPTGAHPWCNALVARCQSGMCTAVLAGE